MRERGVAVLLMPAVRGVGQLVRHAGANAARFHYYSSCRGRAAPDCAPACTRRARGEVRMGCPSFDRVSEREIWAWCGRPRPSCAVSCELAETLSQTPGELELSRCQSAARSMPRTGETEMQRGFCLFSVRGSVGLKSVDARQSHQDGKNHGLALEKTQRETRSGEFWRLLTSGMLPDEKAGQDAGPERQGREACECAGDWLGRWTGTGFSCRSR